MLPDVTRTAGVGLKKVASYHSNYAGICQQYGTLNFQLNP